MFPRQLVYVVVHRSQLVSFIFLAWSSQLLHASEVQMRSKHARSHDGERFSRVAAAIEVDPHGVAKRLHRVASVTQSPSPNDAFTSENEPVSENVPVTKLDIAEPVVTDKDAQNAEDFRNAQTIKITWNMLQRENCHAKLIHTTMLHAGHILEQLHGVKSYAGWADKMTKSSCKERCVTQSVKVRGDLKYPVSPDYKKEGGCLAVAYLDKPELNGMQGYCLLFTSKDWQSELMEKLGDGLNVTGIGSLAQLRQTQTPIEADADEDIRKDNHDFDDVADVGANLAGASLLQPERKAKQTLSDDSACLETEWCCFERHDIAVQ